MSTKLILTVNFYIMSLIIVLMLISDINKKGLPQDLLILLGIENTSKPTTVKATRN